MREKLLLLSSKTSREFRYDKHLVPKLSMGTLERVSQRSSIERERKRANIFSRKAPSVIFFKVIKIVVVLLMFKKMNMDSLLTDMINYFITM